MPQVDPASFLTLHYRLSGPDGRAFINTFDGPPATLSLGAGELSPAIEQRLLGLEEGVRVQHSTVTNTDVDASSCISSSLLGSAG